MAAAIQTHKPVRPSRRTSGAQNLDVSEKAPPTSPSPAKGYRIYMPAKDDSVGVLSVAHCRLVECDDWTKYLPGDHPTPAPAAAVPRPTQQPQALSPPSDNNHLLHLLQPKDGKQSRATTATPDSARLSYTTCLSHISHPPDLSDESQAPYTFYNPAPKTKMPEFLRKLKDRVKDDRFKDPLFDHQINILGRPVFPKVVVRNKGASSQHRAIGKPGKVSKADKARAKKMADLHLYGIFKPGSEDDRALGIRDYPPYTRELADEDEEGDGDEDSRMFPSMEGPPSPIPSPLQQQHPSSRHRQHRLQQQQQHYEDDRGYLSPPLPQQRWQSQGEARGYPPPPSYTFIARDDDDPRKSTQSARDAYGVAQQQQQPADKRRARLSSSAGTISGSKNFLCGLVGSGAARARGRASSESVPVSLSARSSMSALPRPVGAWVTSGDDRAGAWEQNEVAAVDEDDDDHDDVRGGGGGGFLGAMFPSMGGNKDKYRLSRGRSRSVSAASVSETGTVVRNRRKPSPPPPLPPLPKLINNIPKLPRMPSPPVKPEPVKNEHKARKSFLFGSTASAAVAGPTKTKARQQQQQGRASGGVAAAGSSSYRTGPTTATTTKKIPRKGVNHPGRCKIILDDGADFDDEEEKPTQQQQPVLDIWFLLGGAVLLWFIFNMIARA